MSTTNALNRFDYNNLDWEAYRGHRPPYLEGLYKLIYDYHEQGGSGWKTAADIGCGGGVITIELSKKFDKLFACDLSPAYVAEAQKLLKEMVPDFDRRVTILQTGAEDLSAIPDASVDMITMGMMIHWVDHRKAIAENARILKPGGTMMAVIYGLIPLFPDSPELQEASDELFQHWWVKCEEIFSENSVEQCRTYIAELNSLYFDPALWKDVHRYRWRSDQALAPDNKFGREPSRVGQDDVIVKDLEQGLMQLDVNLEWLKVFVDNFLPDPRILKHMESAPWSKVERAFKGGSARMMWPASMVLARKT